MGDGLVLGVDLGGTKLAVGVGDGAGGLRARRTLPTRPERGPEAIVADVVRLARSLARGRLLAAGVGCPGPLDLEAGRVLALPNLPGWEGFPLRDRLTEALGVPVVLANDATAGALGEYRFGAGRGCTDLIYLAVGTGIGGGIVAGGRLVSGGRGNAGEFGHLTLVPDGRPCACGRAGCLEAYASGPAIARLARERLGRRARGVTAAWVARRAAGGDPDALAVWGEAMDALARGIASLIHCLDPQLVVVGGGVAAAGPLMFDRLASLVSRYTMATFRDTAEVVPAALGAESALLGAMALAAGRGHP